MITRGRGAQEFSPARKEESDPCCRQLPPRTTIARRDSAPRGAGGGGTDRCAHGWNVHACVVAN
jgi:hypothetical protein